MGNALAAVLAGALFGTLPSQDPNLHRDAAPFRHSRPLACSAAAPPSLLHTPACCRAEVLFRAQRCWLRRASFSGARAPAVVHREVGWVVCRGVGGGGRRPRPAAPWGGWRWERER